jgi:hypothetical protein
MRAFLLDVDSSVQSATASSATTASEISAICNLCVANSTVSREACDSETPLIQVLKTSATVSPAMAAKRWQRRILFTAPTKKIRITRARPRVHAKRNCLELVCVRTLISRFVMPMTDGQEGTGGSRTTSKDQARGGLSDRANRERILYAVSGPEHPTRKEKMALEGARADDCSFRVEREPCFLFRRIDYLLRDKLRPLRGNDRKPQFLGRGRSRLILDNQFILAGFCPLKRY